MNSCTQYLSDEEKEAAQAEQYRNASARHDLINQGYILGANLIHVTDVSKFEEIGKIYDCKSLPSNKRMKNTNVVRNPIKNFITKSGHKCRKSGFY